MVNLKYITKEELTTQVDEIIKICKNYEGDLFIYLEAPCCNNPNLRFDYIEDYKQERYYYVRLFYVYGTEPTIIWQDKYILTKEQLILELYELIKDAY